MFAVASTEGNCFSHRRRATTATTERMWTIVELLDGRSDEHVTWSLDHSALYMDIGEREHSRWDVVIRTRCPSRDQVNVFLPKDVLSQEVAGVVVGGEHGQAKKCSEQVHMPWWQNFPKHGSKCSRSQTHGKGTRMWSRTPAPVLSMTETLGGDRKSVQHERDVDNRSQFQG